MSYGTDKPNFLEFKVKMAKNDLECEGQWPPFSILAQSIPGCTFGANLVILAQICDELWHGQAKFPRIQSKNGQNDIEWQGQWPPFSIPAESIPGCMFGANMVIPVQTCDELSCGQGKFYGRTDGQTDGRTDTGNDNTLRTKRSRGKGAMWFLMRGNINPILQDCVRKTASSIS